jgi:inorganic pyrophosphatase/exopolyphosphatase
MENPFVIDWDKEKKRLLKRDYRDVCICVAVALILLPLAYFVTSRFEDKDVVLVGSFIYMASVAAGILAVAFYIDTRNFGKELPHPATSKAYEELLDLTRKYHISGAQCREAVVELLARQGHLTGWQVNWLIQDLKEIGDRERVEALKEAFFQKSLENGKELAE